MQPKPTDQTKTYIISGGRQVRAQRPDLKPSPGAASVRFLIGQGMTPDGLNLRISMPGVFDEDFAFRIESRGLFLFGTRRRPSGFGEVKKFALRYGDFQQRIPLPAGLDTSHVTAHLHHGVLDIYLPFSAAETKSPVSSEFRPSGIAVEGLDA